jgi:hypothetical protein
MRNSFHQKVWIASLIMLVALNPALAKTKKKAATTPTPAPTPVASPNRAAMARALQFYVYEKSSDVVNDVTGLFDQKSQKVTLKCELKNLTQREIHGVRGTLRFTTFFGEKIADISIETTAVLPPGEVVGVNWNIPVDRLSPAEFEKLKKAKLEEMKQIWYPSMVVFTDGAVLK